MDWRPSDVHPSPRKLVFFGHFQPAFACPVVFLAEISFFQGSLVRQMLLLAKEMKEKVKNEIVLHPPNSDARCLPLPPSPSSDDVIYEQPLMS